MKINPEDIKVGLQLLAWDVEDRKYYKTEIYKIEGNIIYLKDVDEYSTWQGMEWQTTTEDIQDMNLYKAI